MQAMFSSAAKRRVKLKTHPNQVTEETEIQQVKQRPVQELKTQKPMQGETDRHSRNY